jgi:hypothetical protein
MASPGQDDRETCLMASPGQDDREKTRGTEVRSTNSSWRALKRASHDEIFLLFLILFFFALFPRIPLRPRVFYR